MLKLIREVLGLLSYRQKKALVFQQVLVVGMAISELVSVASIGPFMALVSNPHLVETNRLFAAVYQASALRSPASFLLVAGLAVLAVVAISSTFAVVTLWKNSLFASKVGTELTDGLFDYYMHKPWLFHSRHGSADLNAKISGVETVAFLIIQPLINLVARSVVILFIAVPLLVFSPSVALTGLLIFAFAYLILYRHVRQRLMLNGISTSELNYQRFELRAEALGGIRDVLLLHRQQSFVDPFRAKGVRLARNSAVNQLLGQFPRYLVELIAFGAIVLLVLYLTHANGGNIQNVLPMLAIYALGSFKLLPAFQSVYINLAQMRIGQGAFEFIRKDLAASQAYVASGLTGAGAGRVRLEQGIALRDVHFSYPDREMPALHGMSLKIPVNKVIGLVGSSGSGKSTTVDILLGLISPDRGDLLVDGQPLTPDAVSSWQNALGYVPQTLFLANTTIARNIAFGLSTDEIDMEKVKRAATFAHLDSYVAQLPEGLDTQVGERGIQLSGGQRQRIGIARALYNDADMLILDEATSSLDGITEGIIMDALHDFSGRKTIVMIAHRLSTVRKCDLIYVMDRGRTVAEGTYDELLQKSELFRELAGRSQLDSAPSDIAGDGAASAPASCRVGNDGHQ